jgi:hypothetical protein
MRNLCPDAGQREGEARQGKSREEVLADILLQSQVTSDPALLFLDPKLSLQSAK